MTQAIAAAARAMTYIEDGEYEEFAIAALRAALPAEPPAEAIEAMAKAMSAWLKEGFNDPNAEDDRRWWRRCAVTSYRTLRAHLLGEDA